MAEGGLGFRSGYRYRDLGLIWGLGLTLKQRDCVASLCGTLGAVLPCLEIYGKHRENRQVVQMMHLETLNPAFVLGRRAYLVRSYGS